MCTHGTSEKTWEDIKETAAKFRGYVTCGGGVRASTRLKYYGDELAEIMMVNQAIFRCDENAPSGSSQKTGKIPDRLKRYEEDIEDFIEGENENNVDKNADNLRRAKSRARKAVFDFAMCNPDLDTFVTFTLNGELIDRYDYNIVIKKLNNWLGNRVRRNGLKYVFVCEKHKDGALHFHGVLNSSAVTLTDSGHTDRNGHKIYHVDSWQWGFTTAIYCYGRRSAVCKYITKYITKSTEKVGGRWYYSGGELKKPRYEYLGTTTPEEWKGLEQAFELYEKEIPETGRKFTILSRVWGQSSSGT